MLDDPVRLFDQYIQNDLPYWLPLIRGSNPSAFTRHSKISYKDAFLQTITRKCKTQYSELMAYYSSMTKIPPVNEKSFFAARRKFNPEAIRVMSDEFIARIYDNYDDSIKKLFGLVILAIDGSKCVVPYTEENCEVFGQQVGNSDNEPAMCLISTLHDTMNNLKLDVLIDKYTGSEHDLAARHIDYYCDNFIQKALFTADRGYVSTRLIDQIISRGQYFLIRCKSGDYKKYFDQIGSDEGKIIDITFDRVSTNEYRDDRKFRIHLMNTTYHLRFAKIVIGTDDDGNDVVERLVTNLPEEKISIDDLKELYHDRWAIETSYNRLKTRMRMEEFSGYKPDLIKQDIYADAWLYNLVSLKIMEADEKRPLEQRNGEYTVSRNFNKSIGTLKNYLLKSLMASNPKERKKYTELIDKNISSQLNWVKKEPRQYPRKKPVNKSKVSYRSTF